MGTSERCCNFISVSSSHQRPYSAAGFRYKEEWRNTFLKTHVPYDKSSLAAGRRRESQRARLSWPWSPELKPCLLRMRSRNWRIALECQPHPPTERQDPRAVSRLSEYLR